MMKINTMETSMKTDFSLLFLKCCSVLCPPEQSEPAGEDACGVGAAEAENLPPTAGQL